MRGVPSSDLKAYFEEARRWDEDRLGSAVRSRRLAWIIASAAMALAGAAVVAVASLAPLKTIEPIVVRVDKTTGAVEVVTTLDDAISVGRDEAVTKYFLGQYVRARESYLAASAAEDFRQVAILSSTSEQRRWADLYRGANPLSPQIRYGPDGAAEAQIRAISFINDRVANIRFRRVVRQAQAQTTEDWIATVAFAYTTAPMAEADRLRNPLGFQVTSYRADPEIAP